MNGRGFWGTVICSLLLTLAALTLAVFGIRELESPPSSDDLFSLGQLLVEALLFPATFIGFVLAYRVYRKNTARPCVDLYWGVGLGGAEKDIALPRDQASWIARPMLKNTGDAVGLWYMLRFEVPDDLIAGLEPQEYWRPIVGGPENWRPADLRNSQTGERVAALYTFLSQGQWAVYPEDEGLLLGDLHLRMGKDRQLSDRYSIPYTISTDWGQKQKGVLTLRLQ